MNNQDRINTARNYLKSGNKKEAKALLKDAVRHDPGDARVWYLLSQSADSKELRNYYIDKAMVMKLDPIHDQDFRYSDSRSLPPQELARLPLAVEVTEKKRNPFGMIITGVSLIVLVSLLMYVFSMIGG